MQIAILGILGDSADGYQLWSPSLTNIVFDDCISIMHKHCSFCLSASLLLAMANCSLLGSPMQVGKPELRKFSSPFNYGEEAYNDVFVDDDGTCYLIGTSNGPLNNDYSSQREKLFLHRYKGTSLRWQKVIMDKSSDLIGKSIVNLDTQSFVAIYKRSEDSYSGPGLRAKRVSKLNGKTLWDKQLKFNARFADSFAFTSDGRGNFYQIENLSDDSLGVFLSCYSSNGVLKWRIKVPFRLIRERWDQSSAVTLAFWHDGSFAAAGEVAYANSGVTLPTVIRYSAAGKKLWQKFYPGTNASTFNQICIDRNGFIYVANEVAGQRTVRKLSRNGSVLWRKTYSFGADDMQIVLGRLIMRTPGYWYENKISLHVCDLSGKKLSVVDARFPHPFPYTSQSGNSDETLTKMAIGSSGHAVAIAPYSGDALVQTFRFTRKDARKPSMRIQTSSPVKVSASGKSVIIRGTASDDIAPLRVAYRIKAPGKKAYGGWRFLSLGTSSANAPWILKESLERPGKWFFEVAVDDVAFKRSASQIVAVIKK